MTSSTLEFTRGDTRNLNVTVRDATSGEPVDITDWTVFFTVKHDIRETDEQAAISKTVTDHSDPTSGLTTIVLSSEDLTIEPGKYTYDFQVKDDGGNVMSQRHAQLTIVPDVTQRTS